MDYKWLWVWVKASSVPQFSGLSAILFKDLEPKIKRSDQNLKACLEWSDNFTPSYHFTPKDWSDNFNLLSELHSKGWSSFLTLELHCTFISSWDEIISLWDECNIIYEMISSHHEIAFIMMQWSHYESDFIMRSLHVIFIMRCSELIIKSLRFHNEMKWLSFCINIETM